MKITFKIDEESFKKVEARRGDRTKTEFYRSIINDYLSNKPHEDQTNQTNQTNQQVSNLAKEFETLRAEMAYKDAMIKSMKDEKIKDMQSQLNFLQIEYQKLSSQLLKLPIAKWWQFWK